VSRRYGVLRPTGAAERVTFIISPEGKIAKIIRNVKPEEHPARALEYLKQVIK
jgi:peroxiredoxin Q/BCP